MKWNDFLTHPEVAASHINEHPGKYLFLKTIHEIVAGLNGYKGWVLIELEILLANNILDKNQDRFAQWNTAVNLWSQASQGNIPNDIQVWVSQMNPIVEKWLTQLMLLRQQYESETMDNSDWSSVINKLTAIVDEISIQNNKAQSLTVPDSELEKKFVIGLTTCVARVNKICGYIQDKEYIKLWNFPNNNEA